MSTAGLLAFNLLLNGAGSFAVAWVLARGALRLFRAAPGRAHVTLLALPFVKVAADAARGVPAGSFLWLRAEGASQDMGFFQLGFGVSWIFPRIQLALGALSSGRRYTQSAADLLAVLLARKVSPAAPAVVAGVLLAVAAVRLARRAAAWRRASRERRDLLAGAALIGRRRLGFRTVVIAVSEGLVGSPFTGGVLRPYVVFPKLAWDALPAGERRAALGHELAHASEHHVLVTALAGVIRDVLWFVPFIGAAEKKLREACELCADALAVARGAGREELASALVRTRELLGRHAGPLSPTLAASGASLSARVARLLDAPAPPRLGFGRPWARAALTAWVASAVLLAIAFGNH